MKSNPLLRSARRINNDKKGYYFDSLTFCNDVIRRAKDGESASDDVLMLLEKLLRMAKRDQWIDDWECHLADTLNEYYHPRKVKS